MSSMAVQVELSKIGNQAHIRKLKQSFPIEVEHANTSSNSSLIWPSIALFTNNPLRNKGDFSLDGQKIAPRVWETNSMHATPQQSVRNKNHAAFWFSI
jgi:hypothetical protein